MTSFSSDTGNHRLLVSSTPASPTSEPPLGWEGHVHVHEETPIWFNRLRNWPELRLGLAWSLIFVGAVLGSSVAVLQAYHRQKSESLNI